MGLKQNQPYYGNHHENNSQNADAYEDDVAQVVRLTLRTAHVAFGADFPLLGPLLEAALLIRNDRHRCYLPHCVALHLVLLHFLLLSIREIDVELVDQHGDVLLFLHEVTSMSLNSND